ncbi:unnamed protein product [Moneuplotes crassus]|uniref:Uncharacterized protein n=1 Tax=Euplotes crassus TaxID=5936 RepID=A0AAD2DBU6_EUPCR|nr:unnamed protein product [Moneuplotes crassus]
MDKSSNKSFKKEKTTRFDKKDCQISPRFYQSMNKIAKNSSKFDGLSLKKTRSQASGPKRVVIKTTTRQVSQSPMELHQNNLLKRMWRKKASPDQQFKRSSQFKRPKTAEKIAKKMKFYYSPYSNKLNCGSYMVFNGKNDPQLDAEVEDFKINNDLHQDSATKKWKLVYQYIDTLTPEFYQLQNGKSKKNGMNDSRKRYKKRKVDTKKFSKMNSFKKSNFKSSRRSNYDKSEASSPGIKNDRLNLSERIDSCEVSLKTSNKKIKLFDFEDETSMNQIKEEEHYIHKSDKDIQVIDNSKSSSFLCKSDSSLSRCKNENNQEDMKSSQSSNLRIKIKKVKQRPLTSKRNNCDYKKFTKNLGYVQMKNNYCKNSSQNASNVRSRKTRSSKSHKKCSQNRVNREGKIKYFKICNDSRIRGNYSGSLWDAEREGFTNSINASTRTFKASTCNPNTNLQMYFDHKKKVNEIKRAFDFLKAASCGLSISPKAE